MKIAVLNQLSHEQANGGGEKYQQHFFSYLKSLGHTVNVYTPNYYLGQLESNLFFLWDVFNCPSERGHNWFKQEELDRIVDSFPYITGDCGYSTICDQDYLPCGLGFKGCPQCCCEGPRKSWLQKYYKNAKANIFLSPLHAKTVQKAIDVELKNVVLLGPTIDTNVFYNQNLDKEWDIIFVGVFGTAKGAHYLINQYGNTEKKVLVIGPNLWPHPLPKNFKYIGSVSDRKELANYYNVSSHFWAKTAWPEPFGLTTIEALLCGCTIITDEVSRSGAVSWSKNWRDCWLDYDFGSSAKNCWLKIAEKL